MKKIKPKTCLLPYRTKREVELWAIQDKLRFDEGEIDHIL